MDNGGGHGGKTCFYILTNNSLIVYNASVFLDCVVTANSVNSFINNIDKHWRCENTYFDWEASIVGYTF